MELTRRLLTFWLLLMTQNEIIIVINTVVLIFHLQQKHEKYWQSCYTPTQNGVYGVMINQSYTENFLPP